MHVHQCKNAKHNERILLDQSPQEATIVVSSTHVQRLSGRGRSAALVSRLNLAWKTIFLRTRSFWSNFLTRPVLFRSSRKVKTRLGSLAIHKHARIVVPQTCHAVSTYCRRIRFEIHKYIYTCIYLHIHIFGVLCPIYVT